MNFKILSIVGILILFTLLSRFRALARQSREAAPERISLYENGADRKLPDCPGKPNCVSSQARVDDAVHFIAPLQYPGASSRSEAHAQLLKHLSTHAGMTVMDEGKPGEDHIRTEFRSLIFGFIDDLEFHLPAAERVIHVRSASRVGHSDLGANRKRVEAIRAALAVLNSP
ncbi:MAG: DUF1499 domain-containing protein [Methylotenera sp.]|nr:DUF1499 domain-containing protein [Oligoflexia bacterium]